LLFLCGCVYRTNIYSPEAISPSDHPQGSTLFIYRDGLNGSAWVYDGKDSVGIRFQFSTVNGPAVFLSEEFYVESGGKEFNLIAPVKFLSGPFEADGITTREILRGKVLVLEFPKGIQELSSFTLHLPSITTGNRQTVPNFESITFKKKNVWKAITIN